MNLVVNINGHLCPPDDAKISVLDHGFLFGDSVYEVLRTYQAKLFLFSRHFRRLERSARTVFLPLPWDADRTRQEAVNTLRAATWSGESRLRLIVSRGDGDMNPDPASCARPTIVVLAWPLPEPPADLYARGVHVVTSPYVRTRELSDIKTGSQIRQVLAVRDASERGAYEAVLLNASGQLSDGTSSNIYFVRNGMLFTPSMDADILSGITREVLLELAPGIGLTVVEGEFDRKALAAADEAFLTSTSREIVPITKFDGVGVGDGVPGVLTKRLWAAYRAAIPKLLEEP